MKKLLISAATVALLTSQTAYAGGLADTVMEVEDIEMVANDSSSGNVLIPLILLALIFAAMQNGGGGGGAAPEMTETPIESVTEVLSGF